MKSLFLSLGSLLASSSLLAYQPVRLPPPPMPHFVPPAHFQPPAYPYRGVPVPYGHFVPYAAPVYPYPAPPRRPLTQPSADEKPLVSTEEVAPESQSEKPPAQKSVQSASGKKSAFLGMLRPIVDRENDRLRSLRSEVEHLLAKLESGRASDAGRARLSSLARDYRVKGRVLTEPQARQDLLSRVDIIPPALALAQAANESAWGTSRFAREGNNLFGIWTYDENKGIVPKKRAKGAKHLVRKFASFDESVRYYLHTLNSHPAYQPLREKRALARARGDRPSAMDLASGLEKYSAKGELYVRLIRELITTYRLASVVDGSPATPRS